MNYRNLGASGLKVSEIALGSWTTYGASLGVDDTMRIVRHAFDAGVNLFDTADVYARGEAERALGAAIRGLPREQLVIATKCRGRVWDGPLGQGLSRKHVLEACDQSLRRLGLDYIDLYQFHAPDPETPIEESLRALEDLVCMGKVVHVGFSNFDHEPKVAAQVAAIQAGKDYLPMTSSQPRWNLLDRHVEKEHVAYCKRNGIGMIVYSPLAQGVLTNKYAGGVRPEGSRATGAFAHFLESEKALTPENVAAVERLAAWCAPRGLETASVAIAWVLRHDVVSSAIVGATSTAQLDQNLRAAEVKLTDAEWREVESAIAGRKLPAAAARKPKVATKKRR
jgi:aryl-alcohol dehydrogenase-like predicted oxidoreductase